MKGIFYTAGLSMVALAFLFLTIVMSEHNAEMQKDISNIALFDSLNNEVTYIENGYKNIVSAVLTINITENNATFRESLPNSAAADFFDAVVKFKQLAENMSVFNLFINTSKIQNTLPLFIHPIGVKYSHEENFGGNQISLSNTSLVTSYVVNLSVGYDSTVNITWAMTGGSSPFRLIVSVKNDTKIEQKLLNFADDSTATIRLGATTATVTVGDASDAGKLVIENNNIAGLVSNIKAEFNTASLLQVQFPDETIKITSPEAVITKTAAIRVK